MRKFRDGGLKLYKGWRYPTSEQLEYMEKEGIPFDVDPAIREIIIDLNRFGYKTFGSCSGHSKRSDYGFITFKKLGLGEYDRGEITDILAKYGVSITGWEEANPKRRRFYSSVNITGARGYLYPLRKHIRESLIRKFGEERVLAECG